MYLEKYNIEFPDSFLVTEDTAFNYLLRGSHFVLVRYSDHGKIHITKFNGKLAPTWWVPWTEDHIYEIFFINKVSFESCTLEQYNRIKAFL